MRRKEPTVQARIWLAEQKVREQEKYIDKKKPLDRAWLARLKQDLARLMAEKERKGL